MRKNCTILVLRILHLISKPSPQTFANLPRKLHCRFRKSNIIIYYYCENLKKNLKKSNGPVKEKSYSVNLIKKKLSNS